MTVLSLVPIPSKIVALLFLAVFKLTPAVHAQTDIPTLNRQIDTFLRRQVTDAGFNGVVLVARKDHIVFQQAYGYANFELRVKMKTDHRFKLMSITKQFTALAVTQLIEKGILKATDSPGNYLKNWPAKWSGVTIRQMLNHSSGIPDLTNEWAEAWQPNEVEALETFLEKSKDVELSSEPGKQWRYNNFTYTMLGILVGKLTQGSLGDYLTKNVFGLSGMKDSGFDQVVKSKDPNYGDFIGPVLVPNIVTAYQGEPGKLSWTNPQLHVMGGAGFVWSTAADMYKYARAVMTHRLISPGGFSTMYTHTTLANPEKKIEYGFGWLVDRNLDGKLVLRHSGGNNGYSSDFAIYPEDEVVIVVLTNTSYGEPTTIRSQIAKMVFGVK